VTVVPVVPVVSVAVVSAVLVTVDGKFQRASVSYISIKGDKHCRNNCHSIYWHHGQNCHSDYRSSRKYHRAIVV
jgi:hypothetical protein